MQSAQYSNLKFDSKEDFMHWLKNTTKYEVTLEDKGQDLLRLYVDIAGEIIHCAPCQSSIWNGKIVDLKSLKKGKKVYLNNTGYLMYKIIEVKKYQ